MKCKMAPLLITLETTAPEGGAGWSPRLNTDYSEPGSHSVGPSGRPQGDSSGPDWKGQDTQQQDAWEEACTGRRKEEKVPASAMVQLEWPCVQKRVESKVTGGMVGEGTGLL